VTADRSSFEALTRRANSSLPSLPVAASFVLLIACLYWAQAVLIPIALAILLTFVLSPVTTALQQAGLGRAPSVLVVIMLTACLLGAMSWIVYGQVTSLAAELPKYRTNIIQKVRHLRSLGKGGALEKFQETVEDARDEFVQGDTPLKSAKRAPTFIQADPFALWAKPMASAALVFGLLIFMLAQREELRDRLIRVVGYSNLTVTTKALEDVGLRITRYLLMQLTINGCFGVTVAVALFLIGLPYAFLWGLLSVPLLFIPLVGFWTAVSLPTILSLSFFTDWWWSLVVIGLFLLLKSVINLLLEPLLYGRSVGVSQVPLLVMIAFWTWLWGPIGLILATPLTVCLVVLAKHVPQLEFIGVLLSDEPVMDPRIGYYQRLLAMDQDEALEILENCLNTHSREQLYDEILVPALGHAKGDLRQNKITEQNARFIFKATREIIHSFASIDPKLPASSDNEARSGSVEKPNKKIHVVGCPAHDEGDEVALLMLRQLLDSTPYDVEVLSAKILASETAAVVAEKNPALICIFALAPGGLAQARYLCKRLRALTPSGKIIVGRLNGAGELDRSRDLLLSAGADQVGDSLRETCDRLLNLRPFISDQKPARLAPVN
jgi:predicted PurR-regulated permease PerM